MKASLPIRFTRFIGVLALGLLLFRRQEPWFAERI